MDALAFDPATDTTAILTDGGANLLLRGAGEPRSVTLDGRAVDMTVAAEGRLLLPMDGRVQIVDAASGEKSAVTVDGDARSALFLPDGKLAVGLAGGKVQLVDPTTSEVTETISGLASVDELALTDGDLSALDRRQTSLTEIDLGDSSLGMALRAGEGATQLVTDEHERILVTDTAGDELLVFTTDPLMMRQRYPVPHAPTRSRTTIAPTWCG